MNLIKDATIRKGVLSSLIATAFFIYLLEPIINNLSKGLLFLGSFFSSTFIDGLYKEMAKGKIDYSFFPILIFFIFGATAFFINGIIIFSSKREKKEQEEKKDETPKENTAKGIKIKLFFGSLSFIFSFILLFTIIMANINPTWLSPYTNPLIISDNFNGTLQFCYIVLHLLWF